MPTSTKSLTQLQREAIAALRRYFTGAESERTESLRVTADCFISAREHFFTREGLPDWLGRTHAYRRWVRETMTLGNVPADDMTTVQAAIRYHSGNMLRDRLDDDTLAALGLRPEGPRERSVERRERDAEARLLFGAGPEITDAEDVLAGASMIETFIRRVALQGASPAEREEVRAALHKACAHVDEAVPAGAKRP